MAGVLLSLSIVGQAIDWAACANQINRINLKGLGAGLGAPLHRSLAGSFNTFRITASTATRDVELDYVNAGLNGFSKLAGLEMDSHEYQFYGTGVLTDPLSANNLVALPLAYGPIVIAYNLPLTPPAPFLTSTIYGSPRLCLTPDMLVKIFSGQITKWSDPALNYNGFVQSQAVFSPPLKSPPKPPIVKGSLAGGLSCPSAPAHTVSAPPLTFQNTQCRHANMFLRSGGICYNSYVGTVGTANYWNIYDPIPAPTPPATAPQSSDALNILVRGDDAITTLLLSLSLGQWSPATFGPKGTYAGPFKTFPSNLAPTMPQVAPASGSSPSYFRSYPRKPGGSEYPIIGWLQNTPFSMAVVTLADALKFGLSVALILNQGGNFVDANATSTAAAISQLASNFQAEQNAPPDSHWLLEDQTWNTINLPGPLSYPILGRTYIVTRRTGAVKTANMAVQSDGAIWIDCDQQSELLYYFYWATTNPDAVSIANGMGYQPLGANAYALVEANILKTMQCGVASQYSVYDTFQSQLSAELQIKQPYTMLAIFIVVSIAASVSLSMLAFRLARNILEEIDDDSSGGGHGGRKGTATQNFFILVLALVVTGVTAVVLTLVTGTVSVEDRTHAFMIAIPLVIVVHFFIGGNLYWANRKSRLASMVFGLAYKIRPEDIRMVDVSPNRYRNWLQSKMIVHPDDSIQQLKVGRLRDRYIILRRVNIWMHNMKPSTRRLLVRFVSWTKEEPPNILWFYGISEFGRNRYIISTFCPIGDLATVLSMDDTINLDTMSKLSFAGDIADGMLFLHGRNIIHANLKSCCCFVDTDWNIKVSGWEYHTIYNLQAEFTQVEDVLREELGEDEMEKYFPWLFWTAPERLGAALRGFTIEPVQQSDTYSYGIVLTEIFSRQKPYATVRQAMSAPDVLKCIIHGARPLDDVPWLEDELPTGIIALMQSCWHVRIAQRPTFNYITDAMASLRPPKKSIRNQFYSEDNKQKERVAKEKQFVQGLINKVELVEKARRRKDANEYTIPLSILEQMLANKQAIPAPNYFRDAHILGCTLGTEFEQLFEKADLHAGIQAVQKLSQVFENFCEASNDGFRLQTNGNMFLFLADLTPSKDSFDTLTTLSDNTLEFLMSCWDIEPPIPWQQVGCAKFYVKLGMHSGHMVAGVHGSNPMQYSVIGAVEDGVRHLVNMSFAFRINLSATTAHKISKLPRFIVQPTQEDLGQLEPVSFYWLRGKQYHDDEKTLQMIWAWTEAYKSSPYGINMKEIAAEYAGNNPLISSIAGAEATGGHAPPLYRTMSDAEAGGAGIKFSVKRSAATSTAGTTEYYAPVMPSVTPGRQLSSSNVNLLTPSAIMAAHSGIGRRQLNPNVSDHSGNVGKYGS